MATKSKTLADFKAIHDPNVVVPSKIRKALEAMTKNGPENWEYEGEFIRLAGISTTQMGAFRDQFVEHIVETSGKQAKRVWFGSTKAAAKARGEL